MALRKVERNPERAGIRGRIDSVELVQEQQRKAEDCWVGQIVDMEEVIFAKRKAPWENHPCEGVSRFFEGRIGRSRFEDWLLAAALI